MQKVLPVTLIITVLVFLSACQKEQPEILDQHFLKKTVSRWGDSTTVTQYFYDDQNRLSSISTSDRNGQEEMNRKELTYDQFGKLAKVTQTWYDGQSHTYQFKYDAHNRIMERLSEPIAATGAVMKNTYTYDTKGRLIADSVYSSSINGVAEFRIYAYDEKDNMIESQIFYNTSTGVQLESAATYEYDNNKNPYSSLGKYFYFVSMDYYRDDFLSRNNIVKIKTRRTVVTSNYTYEGFFPKIKATSSDDDGRVTTLEYFY